MKTKIKLMLLSIIMFGIGFPLMADTHCNSCEPNHIDLKITQKEQYRKVDPLIAQYNPTSKVKIKLNKNGEVVDYKWLGGNHMLRDESREIVFDYLVFEPIKGEDGNPVEAYAILPLKFQ